MYEQYGRTFASFYDELFPPGESAEHAAEFLAGIAAQAPGPGVLELGVGTGRIALPLARRGVDVVGVDISAEMLAVLDDNAKTADVQIERHEADICDVDLGRQFGTIYCVCGTLSILLDIHHQADAIANAAGHLQSGGHLVVETHNPAAVLWLHAGAPQHTSVTPYPDGGALISTGTFDIRSGLWALSHVFMHPARPPRVAQEASRPVSAGELDLMARMAGLELVARHGDFRKSPFSGADPEYVSVYRKP